MTSPIYTAVGMIVALIVPIMLVQAQVEEGATPPAQESVSSGEGEVAAPVTQEETSAPDASTEQVTPEVAAAEDATTGEDVPTQEGSVLGASTTEESPAATPSVATTSSEDQTSETTASSTPAGDPPAQPYEEPFVLQPAVKLQISGSSVTADIKLENLTCKASAKVLPALPVKVYYTAWYPNDGPESKEVSGRTNEQTLNVSDVALWSSRAMQWSADGITPGRYYFVVVVDPENANGAYRMHRSEFAM